MAFYLIDYENVRNPNGVGKLSESDTLIFFYTNNANTLSFNLHREILASRASIEYAHVTRGGKNALDFQLSSYLGFLIAKNPKESFYIISKDNGFAFVLDFWINMGFKRISVAEDILKTEKFDSAETVLSQGDDGVSDTAKGETDEAEGNVSELLSTGKRKTALNHDHENTVDMAEERVDSKNDGGEKKEPISPENSALDVVTLRNAIINGETSLSADDAEVIINIVKKFKSKQTINANLQKKFKDQAILKRINKLIKPYLKGKS